MTISIPSSTWDKYYEACDFFLTDNHMSRECTIIYPPKRESCVNCIIKPVGSLTTNVYINGGPAPFYFGSCPLCGGNGYRETEVSATVRLRIYWDKNDWIKMIGNINFDGITAMIIGFMADAPKIIQSTEIILVKANPVLEYRTTLAGKPTPWGFGQDRYFWALVKGV